MSFLKFLIFASFFLALVFADLYEEDEEESEEEESEEYEFSTTSTTTTSTTTATTTTSTTTTTQVTSTSEVTSTSSLQLYNRTIRFDVDFETVIGDRDVLFLSQCNDFWVNMSIPVSCVNVQSGSILLTLQGTSGDLDSAEALLEETGMDLPDFQLIRKEQESTVATQANANQSVTGEIWFFIVIFTSGAACAVVCAYVGRMKCFDDEEGFVPSVHDMPKEIKIGHPPLRSDAIKIEKPKRRHIGLAVRDGSNAQDIRASDGLGKTPCDAPFRQLDRDVVSFEEGARPTGFSVEENNEYMFKPFTRPGEPSIVEMNDHQPTSGIIRLKKSEPEIISINQLTSGIISIKRDSVAVESVHASL